MNNLLKKTRKLLNWYKLRFPIGSFHKKKMRSPCDRKAAAFLLLVRQYVMLLCGKKTTSFRISVILIAITLFFSTHTNANEPILFTETREQLQIIAHRGASGYAPENTIIAFQKAVELGAEVIELDIQLSQDGEIIVAHDATVNRTTGMEGYFKDYSLEQIKQFDVGVFFHQAFKNQKIPTLEEVLLGFNEKCDILIEIKNPQLYPGIEKELAKVIKKFAPAKTSPKNIMVQSFHIESLQQFHQLMPDIPVGVVLSDKQKMNKTKMLYDISLYASFVNFKAIYLEKNLVDKIHALNMDVFAWTVNEPIDVLRLSQLDVDGIVTNYPDILTMNIRTPRIF